MAMMVILKTRTIISTILCLLLLFYTSFGFLTTSCSSLKRRKSSFFQLFQEPPEKQATKNESIDIGTLFGHLFNSSTTKKTNKRIVMPKKVEKKEKSDLGFQERLLKAQLKFGRTQLKTKKKERQKTRVQKSLKHIRILKNYNETSSSNDPVSKQAIRQARKALKDAKLRKQAQFQQRLLHANMLYAARAKEIEQMKKRSRFQQSLLSAKLENDENAKEHRTRMFLNEIIALEEQTKKQEHKRKMTRLHQALLAARIENEEKEKQYNQRRLLEQIIRERQRRQRHQQDIFQQQLLGAAIRCTEKAKDQKKQGLLNSILQNQQLISYTKNKIGEISKVKFQRKLLAATLQNERIRRQKQREQLSEKEELQFRQRLMKERINSRLKKEAERIEKQQKADFQTELIQFYQSVDLFEKEKKRDELEKEKREKKISDAQERLLSATIRNDLVEKQRVAKQRIDELYKSLMEAKKQTEMATAEMAKAEAEKRTAELELEEGEAEQENMKQQRKEALQRQIKESQQRQEQQRQKMEKAGRQGTPEDASSKTMDEYDAILVKQRNEDIQRKIGESRRREEQLRLQIEDAGRQKSSEETSSTIMDQYELQKTKELQQREQDAKRRQELIQKQMENVGREEKATGEGEAMDTYRSWMAQGNKTLSPSTNSAASTTPLPPAPETATEENLRQALEQAGRQTASQERQQPPRLTEHEAAQIRAEQNAAQLESAPQQQLQTDPEKDLLIGNILLSKFCITEKLRVGGDRSVLYKCFHIQDKAQQHPLVIKLSHNTEQIELEHRIYGDLFSRLTPEGQHLFVKAYDWVGASPVTEGKVGFVMECGTENLRGYIWRHGPFQGKKLRNAMENVIRIVHSLHDLRVVWTELKAENFIVFGDGDIIIKAVDLESVAAHGEYLRAYTAETYPPEFPADSLYQCLPQIPVDYSFDIWALGLTMYEMAVGEPLFTLQRTYDVEYIKERLKNPDGIIAEANKKMWKVEAGARNIIRRCLVVDPTKRSSCEELLQDAYFQPQPTVMK